MSNWRIMMTYVQPADTNWIVKKTCCQSWRMNSSLSSTRLLTVAKNRRFKSKNPLALIVILNLLICSINSCFALCSSSSTPHQNTNSSTFLASSNCWNSWIFCEFCDSIRWRFTFYLGLAIVAGIEQRHSANRECREIKKRFWNDHIHLNCPNVQLISFQICTILTAEIDEIPWFGQCSQLPFGDVDEIDEWLHYECNQCPSK